MQSSDTRVEGEVVILVHGLYLHGLAMVPLQRRLNACGFRCRRFSYPSLRDSVANNATRLSRYLHAIDTPIVHFVCHSLGGLLVRAMLLQSSWRRPGRVLTLGTPHLGSYVATRLDARPELAWILGESFRHGLDGDLRAWPMEREVGTISGSRAIGAGRVVPGLPKPNDGTVAVAETELGPEYPRVVLAETHSSLLISRRAAACACAYLHTGRFPDLP